MICIDFEYAEHKLSDFDCVICNINNTSEGSTDNTLTYNTLTSRNNKFDLLYSEYEEPLKFTMEIAKNPCNSYKNKFFTHAEVDKLKTWLNRRDFLKFSPIYDEKEDFPHIYCRGSFNVKPIPIGGKIVGLELNFTSNAPYAYYEPLTYSFDVPNADGQFTIYSMSDEVGQVYVNAEIECLADGDLKIFNSRLDEKVTVINNCKAGEIITLNGKVKIIDSSLKETRHKTLYNDFNYSFPVIAREYAEIQTQNVFTVTLPCKIKITYSPICKLGVI